jgi:phosphoribosylamine---glycine ligase
MLHSRMRFLGIGHSGDLGDMYLRLQSAGHEVRFYCRDFDEHGVMDRMLTRVDHYRAELDWIRAAGSDGVIIFETAEHGALQDELRRDGFQVIGGSALGDRLENDRAFGQRAMSEMGLSIAPTHAFSDYARAIAFVREHPRRYVFKLDGSETAPSRNYVGAAPDGSDIIALLAGQPARLATIGITDSSFVLMEHLEGLETGLGAYFNGEEFLRPACLDWEHKRLFAGDLGELTGEMGTLLTYEDTDRLFDLTLARLAPLLRDGGYLGYINLNTIINERGIWPLELTCRFGYPGFAILDALQIEGWPALFQRMLRRSELRFATTPGFALGVVLTVPPFPYRYGYKELSRGLPIAWDSSLSEAELDRLHFSEVARDANGQLVTSGMTGYIGVATGVGRTITAAQESAYALARRIYVPNLRYRIDIGDAFRDHGQRFLQRLGYLSPR